MTIVFSAVLSINHLFLLIFCREEIRRLKSQNPNMAHKEAFSQAAKNVGLFAWPGVIIPVYFLFTRNYEASRREI